MRKNKKRIDPRYFLHETALREYLSDELSREDAANLLDDISRSPAGNKEFNQALGSLASEDFDYEVEGPSGNLVTYKIDFKNFSTLKWIFNILRNDCEECIKPQGLDSPPTFYQWGPYYGLQGSFEVPVEEERQQTGAAGSMVLVVNKDDYSRY